MSTCIACLSQNIKHLFDTVDLPAGNLNLSKSKKIALNTLQRPLNIFQCNDCNHVFNISSDIKEEHYERDENFTWYESPLWIQESEKLAEIINKKFLTKVSYILEIGSGSGNFARYLSNISTLQIYAYDKSLTNTPNDKKNLHVKKCLFPFNKRDLPEGKPLIIMRHVLEHFQNPNETIKKLKELFYDGFLIVIEVPNAYPTLTNHRFNDFVHEHISYFSLKSLFNLVSIFDGEVLECRNSFKDENIIIIAEFSKRNNSIKHFQKNYSIFKKNIHNFINKTQREKKKIIVWGAGGRGVSIILIMKSMLDDYKELVIVDSDQRKVNHYIPGTEITIKDISELKKMEDDSKIIITTALGLESIKKEIYEKFGNKFSINFLSSNKVIEIK